MSARACAAFLVATGAVASCAEAGPDERFDHRGDPLEIVSTVPGDGATDVDPTQTLDVCFSHVLDPRSVGPLDALLSSGRLLFDVDVDVQLYPWRQPGSRETTSMAWCPGSVVSLRPRAPLRAALGYRISISSIPRGWNGEQLDTTADGWRFDPEIDLPVFSVEFRTAPADPPETLPPSPASPTLTDLFDEGRVFDPSRGLCSCHREAETIANRRLDLSSVAAAYDDLVLRVGPQSSGFPMVSPRVPAESYLVQKLIDVDGQPLHSVVGDPMPLGEEITDLDRAEIAAWVAGGALE